MAIGSEERGLASERAIGQAAGAVGAVTRRSLAIAVALAALAGVWIRESEIVSRVVYTSESVPTIPAVAGLVLLLGLNRVLRRSGRPLSRGELIFIFFFLCVASSVFCPGMTRYLLTLITTPFYFAQSGNRLAEAQQLIPSWAAVHDPAVIKGMYEGVHPPRVPWSLWVGPIAVWVGFFLALWLSMFGLVLLLHRPWVEKEKLSFPLVQLPLEITRAVPGERGFLRNPVMWLGFSLSFFYNATNIAHGLFPSVPGMGREIWIAPFDTPPWNAVGSVRLNYRPELVGFGYLVSTEVSFSIWFAFVIERLVAVLLSAIGYREPGAPFVPEQALGAYLGVAVSLLYLSRRHLAGIVRAALGAGAPEQRGYRGIFFGWLASVSALFLFCRLLGMQWWVAVLYPSLILAVALVYARMRAEAGVPAIWLFPWGMPKAMLFATFGTAPFTVGGSGATLSAMALLDFLSRGAAVSMSGYQVEALRAGHLVRERPGRWVAGLALALVLGVALSFYFHLTGLYRVGAQQVPGGLWGWHMAIPEHNNAVTWPESPQPVARPRVVALGAGFLTVLLLQFLRMQFLGFPLHPLGFMVGISYDSLVWSPFFVVWLVKSLVLRFGGMPLYRKTLPGFLGFALGHLFAVGVVWGFLGAILKGLYEGYAINFG